MGHSIQTTYRTSNKEELLYPFVDLTDYQQSSFLFRGAFEHFQNLILGVLKMRFRTCVLVYTGLSILGWFTLTIFDVVRSLASYCDEERLHNIVR
jgi:hypothetical protein